MGVLLFYFIFVKHFIHEAEEERQVYMELTNKITSIASLRNYLEIRMMRNGYGFDDDDFLSHK